jgi:hypothetical protein
MNVGSSTAPPRTHPSPQRDLVGAGAIAFAIGAGPTAWFVQLGFNASFAAHACFPKDVPLATPLWGSLQLVMLSIDVLALAVCSFGFLMAWRSWQKTGTERPGSAHHLLESGDGRSRFMAMVGMMTSALFFAATAFATLNLAVVPPCNG